MSNRLAILICTADRYSNRTTKCLRGLHETTKHIPYTLMLLDNRGDDNFFHAREMNRALDTSDGPVLVMDDDCFVCGNWLDSMLAQLKPDVGAVSPCAANAYGLLRTRGCNFAPDGTAQLYNGSIPGPVMVPATGSFCLLLNVPAWPNAIRFSEAYKKYFFDPDMLLTLWEHGLSTVIIPEIVIHESGGTVKDRRLNKAELYEHDKAVFAAKWIHSGRYDKLESQIGHKWHGPLRKSIYAKISG